MFLSIVLPEIEFLHFLSYLEKLQFGEKQIAYREIIGNNLIDNLFIHSLFSECAVDLKNEIESNFKVDHLEKTRLILTAGLLSDNFYNSETFEGTLSEWYSKSLEKEFTQYSSAIGGDLNSIFNRLIIEYGELQKITGIVFGFAIVVLTIFELMAFKYITQLNESGICNLSEDLVQSLSEIINSFKEQKPENEGVFVIVNNVDALIKNWDLRRIEAFVVSGVSPENRDLVKNRLRYHINQELDPRDLKGKFYMWMYYYLLEADVNVPFNVVAFVQSCGYGEKSDFETCDMLTKLLYDLYTTGSMVESAVGRAIMFYVARKVHDNPQLFHNEEFIKRCYNLRFRDYFRHPDILRVFNSLIKKNKLQFNMSMFLKCLGGSVVVFILATLTVILLAWLGTINTILMVGVGAILFIIAAIVDIIMMIINSRN